MSTLNRKSALFLSAFMSATAVANVACAWGDNPEYGRANGANSGISSSESRPIAGRNRRRTAMRKPWSVYPQANTDRVSTSFGTNKLRINVLANDSGRFLRIKAVNPRSARGGRVYLKNNRVIYVPLDGYEGRDSFWYTVIDRGGRKHSAKVIVCVCDN